MKNVKIALVAILAAMSLAGCVDTIPIDYSPSSTLTAIGSVQVGDFSYLPSITGKVKPNQIHNTAMGSILFDKNINVYFRNALFTELRFVGVKVGTGDKTLTGEIRDFNIDDLGYSVDWTVDVDYKVTNASGVVIYEADKTTKNHTSKFNNALGALALQVKGNIEALIQDPAFVKAIN